MLPVMARTKAQPKDLTGIRARGGSYQIRVFAGNDLETGKPVMLTGSADDEDAAIELRDEFRRQVKERHAAKTNVTLGYLLDEWLASHQVEASTKATYRTLAKQYLRPTLGDHSLNRLCQLGSKPFERLYADLRVCRRICKGRKFTEHHSGGEHKCDRRCKPHQCKPLAQSSIRQCHAVLSGALGAAKRWGWITVNPLDAVPRPRPPQPQPDPPSSEEAAKIVNAAWAEDDDWGLLVWLALVTGARRGELLALTWEDVDLVGSVLTIRRGLVYLAGETIIKQTKTHQMRRLSLDEVTVRLLGAAMKAEASDQAFVFSYAPDNTKPCSPSGVTHRYARMTSDLGLNTHLHALRHYSATELLTSGVDLRTVAGRLGHGGGGATTLKVYAAWVTEADKKAAGLIAAKLPTPPDGHA
jgi:integrase